MSEIEIAYAIDKSEKENEEYRFRNEELKKANATIEARSKEIRQSIEYGGYIQQAMLHKPTEIKSINGKYFILYLPKDIVSGDFYWFTETDGKIIIAAVDCTGHGVPGAMLSMLGISLLNEIINKRKIFDSGRILDKLKIEIVRALNQKLDKATLRDGMDMALCIIDYQKNIIQYSGAKNNLYLIRNMKLHETPADRMPVGYEEDSTVGFTRHDIPFMKGDVIYMFSDGYASQLGGPEDKKFKTSGLKDLLLKIHKSTPEIQKKTLKKEFYNWKGKQEQVDDVLVIGLKL